MACCETKIVTNDILFRDYWDKVFPFISDSICNAHNFDCFGNADGSQDSYDAINDVYYMFMFAHVAFEEQQLRIKNLFKTTPDDCIDTLTVMKEIFDEFNFECKIEYFKCKHKIELGDILMSVFGIGTTAGKGIDYMRIENNDDCVPTFKIV